MSALMTILYIFLAIALLLFMVLVHEFGHYCAGRALGFKIEEFSVGFGKAIISKKNKRGEKISLRIFPLGGYCAFAGEDNDTGDGAFVRQRPWKRIIVFLAGVTFNFLTAIIFSVILLCSVGYDIPQFKGYEYTEMQSNIEYKLGDKTYYYSIDENSIPSIYLSDWSTHLQKGDVIYAVNGQKIDFAYGKTIDTIAQEIKNNVNKHIAAGNTLDTYNPHLDSEGKEVGGSVVFTVRRDGEYINEDVPIIFAQLKDKDGNNATNEDGKIIYIFSLNMSLTPYRHTFFEALSRCVSFSFGLAWVVLKSLAMLLTFQLPISQIGGPITTISTIATFAQQDFSTVLVLIPLLSANLAVFNALPFPALDGSHVLFTCIEWIRKKPINRKIENIIHTAGLAILFGFVIIVDILHFVL